MPKPKPVFKFVLRKAQITVDGAEPECFHCEKTFPPETRCELYGKTLTFICPNCGLSTVVNISK